MPLVSMRQLLDDSGIELVAQGDLGIADADETAVSFQIVLTKIDTLTGKDLSVLLQNIESTIKSHVAAHPQAILTSSQNKTGIDELQEQLAFFALPERG